MKRISILLALLAILLAACGEQAGQTDADASTPSVVATPTETEEPTPEPDPTDDAAATDDGGSETALEELVPDELNGVARTDIPGMDQIIGSALAQQGLDADDAEFLFTSYGTGEDAVILTAFRIPQVSNEQMEMLGRMLSGAGAEQGVEAETVDVAGKSVLRMTASGAAAGQEGVVFMYFAEGAAFTIVSPSADTAAAEQLLAELP